MPSANQVFTAGSHFVIASKDAYTVFEPEGSGLGSISCESFAVSIRGFKAACEVCYQLERDYVQRNA